MQKKCIRVSYTCNIRKYKGRLKYVLIDWYAIFNAIEIFKKERKQNNMEASRQYQEGGKFIRF